MSATSQLTSLKGKHRSRPITVYCDLDGVIADYVRALADFIGCKEINRSEYDCGKACRLKEINSAAKILEFHLSGGQEKAPLMGDCDPSCLKDPRLGEVIILTARPAWDYHNMVKETGRWLTKHKVRHDDLIFSKVKSDVVKDGILIDDNADNINEVDGKGGIGILIDRPYNYDCEVQYRVRGLREAVELALTLSERHD